MTHARPARLAAALLLLLGLAPGAATRADERKPKYGPLAVRLARSHEYMRESDAPDYWALSPYYAAQDDDRSCSVASAAMVLNAARAPRDLGAEDELVTQRSLLARTENETWQACVGPLGHGVTLDQLGVFLGDALRKHGFERASAEVVHVEDASRAALDRVHAALVENERSARDFIIANFDQGAYTGDEHAGHVAPVAAYDAKRRRVLILDPDRRWYEPYWVPEEAFVAGMATTDPVSGKARGFVWLKLGE
jgi:hypothetical protein